MDSQKKRVIVDDKQRHRRVRLLIKNLNKKRKKQAEKIDILCNDFIAAQRDFIKSLKTISFIANFYESIIGITDLNSLLYTAVKLIKEENADTNVTSFCVSRTTLNCICSKVSNQSVSKSSILRIVSMLS